VVTPSASGSSAGFNDRNTSGWRYITALLGTLAIIGTIAVRRYPTGKSQA
jgi:hypothetical protein